MEIQKYLEKMKAVQNSLLTFIQKDENVQDNYLNFDHLFEHYNIRDDPYELESVLYILSKIADNHHRKPDFFKKIEHVLHIFKNEIKKNFSNSQIFNIFKSNKEILRFLLEEQIMIIDKPIAYIMTNGDFKTNLYPQYFFKELKPFLNVDSIQEISKDLPEDFENKRKEGIEYDYFTSLICNDSIEEFINYSKSYPLALSMPIKLSIFETHSLIINKQLSLFEYTAFCGSFQIFNYLYKNQVEMTPSLWIYSIHGGNLDIIHLIEQSKITPNNDSYEDCLTESIKCHHVDITNYILNNYFTKEKNIAAKAFPDGLKYYNFNFIEAEFINKSVFFDLCQYDYYPLVKILLKKSNIDINARTISN